MLNKILIVGRITDDPALAKTPNGVSLTSFTIACDRPKAKDQDKATTDFVRIKAWNKTAEYICQYCSKGDKIFIEGRLTVNPWTDKDGKKTSFTEIQVETWEILKGKGQNAQPQKQESTPQEPENKAYSDEFDTGPLNDISSDDLPF